MNKPTKAVVFFSGGIMSWAAAKRTVKKYGAENTTLLFTDTLIEDPDLYRFLDEAAENIGAKLVKIADGRDVWQVFNDVKMIGNSMADPCSEHLKRRPGQKWIKDNCAPEDTALVFGIHWEEDHRLEGMRTNKKGERVVGGVRPRYNALGWPHVEAPMCEKPWMTSDQIHAWLKLEGIKRPRLYDKGFAHNNCGGFCVKAGEGHFAHLLREMPELYAHHEEQERRFNELRPGRANQTVLAPQRRQEDGTIKRVPMTLTEFREEYEKNDTQINMFDIGGCGCFSDED